MHSHPHKKHTHTWPTHPYKQCVHRYSGQNLEKKCMVTLFPIIQGPHQTSMPLLLQNGENWKEKKWRDYKKEW